MIIREILYQEKEKFNSVATHPLQSWEWGDFKLSTGVEVLRLGSFEGQKLIRTFQVTSHQIPKLNWSVGYFPKTEIVDEQTIFAAKTAAEKFNLVFVKIEPNVWDVAGADSPKLNQARKYLEEHGCVKGRPQFTPYSFMLDLRPSEDEILANCKNKTRYNIKVAQKHGVEVVIDSSQESFEEYIKLWKETTTRQKFYAHDETYQRNMWKFMSQNNMARLIKAVYQGKTLGVWIVFVFDKVLYYPYGASSREHREVMANNLLAWEAIKYGKSLNCHTFDMWGSLGPEPDENDPWFGFHKFKSGYGPVLAEFVGTYDYVHDQSRYKLFQYLDKWRWMYLRWRSKMPF